jgi:pimeloyl-ACP methyl ester carboxylesterase
MIAAAGSELAGPIVLLHGVGLDSRMWRPCLTLLSEHASVLTPDLLGHGRARGVPGPLSLSAFAQDVATGLPGPVHLVGFSLGALAAQRLTLDRPELVRSLVLAGTGAGGRNRVPRPAHVREAFEAALGLPPEQFGRRTMPYTFSPGWPEANGERFEEILAARLEHPTPDVTLLAHTQACYGFYNEGCPVERLAVRALVLHGDADVIVPVENGRMLAARLPNARYVELQGRGHNLMLEDPETFSSLVLEFLA